MVGRMKQKHPSARREVVHPAVAIGDDQSLVLLGVALDQRRVARRACEGMREMGLERDEQAEVARRELALALAARNRNPDERAPAIAHRQPEAAVTSERAENQVVHFAPHPRSPVDLDELVDRHSDEAATERLLESDPEVGLASVVEFVHIDRTDFDQCGVLVVKIDELTVLVGKENTGRKARDQTEQQARQRRRDRLRAETEAAELPDLSHGPRLARRRVTLRHRRAPPSRLLPPRSGGTHTKITNDLPTVC